VPSCTAFAGKALGLKEHFKGVVPAAYRDAIDAIKQRLTEAK
jgi:hypothetical protein